MNYELGDQESRGATNDALDAVATVPPVGDGVFWAICLCMLCLGLLLGPVDAKLLKRRGLSRYAWLSALAWIAAAGAAAVLVPRIVRSGQSIAGRFVFADTLCDHHGQPRATAHLGVNGIFAGKPITVSPHGAPRGSWLRGVAAVQGYYASQPLLGLPSLHLPIQSQDDADPLRGAWPPSIDVPQWSFRTFTDVSPLHPAPKDAIGAKVRAADGLHEVTLTNLPPDASIRDACLYVNGAYHPMDTGGTPLPNARDRLFRVAPGQSPRAKDWMRTPVTNEQHYWEPPKGTPGSLPWVRERGQVVDALVATGRWACVCVRLEGLPPDLTLSGVPNLRSTQTTMLRLLTPLEAP